MDGESVRLFISVGATLLAGLFGGLIALATASWQRKSEDRRQINQLMVGFALEEWKVRADWAFQNAKDGYSNTKTDALNVTLIYYFKLGELLALAKPSNDDVIRVLREATEAKLRAKVAAPSAVAEMLELIAKENPEEFARYTHFINKE